MFKHTISELKEALLCLQAGQVTLPYPYQPHPPEDGFRGKPVVDPERCIGCGACAYACPPRLISVEDAGSYRSIVFDLSRCTYCASCRDVCPASAIQLSSQFETATPTTADLQISLKLRLVRCHICGAVVGTQRAVNRVRASLYEYYITADGWLDLCLPCKRQEALCTAGLTQEVAP